MMSKTPAVNAILSSQATVTILPFESTTRLCSFLYAPEPRGPTELLKNAKNRFQIGFSYSQESDTNTKIWFVSRKRVVFLKPTLCIYCKKNFYESFFVVVETSGHSSLFKNFYSFD